MSDNDSDYIDIAEDVLDNEVENTGDRPQRKGKRRGADIDWVEIARLSKSDKHEELEYFKDIQEIFTMRKAGDFLCRY